MQTSIFQTLGFRYSMLYVAVISVLTFTILIIAYAVVNVDRIKPHQIELYETYQELKAVDKDRGLEGVNAYLSSFSASEKVTPMSVLLINGDSQTVIGEVNAWPSIMIPWGSVYSFNTQGEGRLHNFLARVYEGKNYKVLIAVGIDDFFKHIKQITIVLSQFMCGVICVGFIGSLIVSKDIIKRVSDINHSIDTIMQGDLSERLSLNDSDRELYVLTSKANKMLDKIQQLLQSKRQFSSNIAHDLRTPLTRLRNHLEELSERVGANNADLTDSLIAEADGILLTFNALLRISNIEMAASKEAFVDMDLAKLLFDVVELYEPLAQDKNIDIDVSQLKRSFLRGDKNLLFQLFANLIDNAIKYSPKNTKIHIYSAYQRGTIIAGVTDQGLGISDEDKARVFEHFYRVESSRGVMPGNGLGLSLVAAVIELHEGKIQLKNQYPGLNVEVALQALSREGLAFYKNQMLDNAKINRDDLNTSRDVV